MAKTTRIQQLVEPFVRDWLKARYSGKNFCAELLPLKTGRLNEFDAVSDDREIVVQILSNRVRTRTGNPNTGGMRKAECDFWRLANLDLPNQHQKLMVFTNEEFNREVYKLVGEPGRLGIEFVTCSLPEKVLTELNIVLDLASVEQRARGDA